MSTLETAKAVLAAWEARDLKAAANLLSNDFRLTGPAPEALPKEAYLMFQAIHNEGFPDWKFNIKEAKVNGDQAHFTFQITRRTQGRMMSRNSAYRFHRYQRRANHACGRSRR